MSKSRVGKSNYVRKHDTLRPRIWLMAADSLSVHSSTTFDLISFMNSMNAFSGFLMWCGFLRSSPARSRSDDE